MQSTNLTTEDGHQRLLFEWAEWMQAKHLQLRLMFAIPNGGKRSKATAGILKATGVKSGVPDICLPVARGGYHGLFIEMKRPKRGKAAAGVVSKDQAEWLNHLRHAGYRAEVCYGFDEARDLLLEYLK